ncbi:unnamed protein product [Adineta steineri]|uniref:RRM domain-containing protein n=2 Tax=Adineta steineri TaxID=433720 RepID=A0A819RKU5_9BILA|nr:unnamed protein product [Adineta steineri]
MASGNNGKETKKKRPADAANLYVKNFGKDMTETELCSLFAACGTITSCKVQTDNNGQSKGFGFVNFEKPEMAQNAIDKLNGYLLDDNKHLYVGIFQRKSERQKELQQVHAENIDKRSNNLCLYISNLDVKIDEIFLGNLFNQFGQVTKTHILRNGTQSKGIGFVCFKTVEETTRALNEMNGKWILSKPIYVSLSKGINNSQLITPTAPAALTNSFSNMTYRPMTPLPYTNFVPMLYIPAMMMQSPSLNNYSMPISPTNLQEQSTRQYTTPSPSLNNYSMPISLTDSRLQSTRQYTTSPPSLNSYPMPISPTNLQEQLTGQHTTLPSSLTRSSSLNSYPIPISPTNLQEQSIRQHTTLSSSSTPPSFMIPSPTTPTSIKRSTYPYTSVKNDDQEKDY